MLGVLKSAAAALEERGGNDGAVEMAEVVDGDHGGGMWDAQLGGALGALANAETATVARAVLAGDGGRDSGWSARQRLGAVMATGVRAVMTTVMGDVMLQAKEVSVCALCIILQVDSTGASL
uniref:Uncharacterized protein n=1 Tax=Oryza punctata TaxID=4537 RepID=A0A0E0LAJ4_ORYPU